MGVGMVTVVVAILIVICGGGFIYKLCTSPCNVCGWFTSCSSCCKKKRQSRLVRDDDNDGDTGVAVHASMESLRGEHARRAQGKEVSIDDTGAPCVCNKVETSEVVQHKCVPITNVLEAYGCRSRRIQRTWWRGQWIWYRKTQRTAPGNRRSRKYLRDASTVIGHESFRKFAKQLRNFRPGIPACTTVQQSRVVAYSARNYWCIRYWKSNQY